MSFKRGDPKPINSGRKQGSENKSTKDIKEAFKKLVEDNLDNMTTWLKQVAADDPSKAMNLLLEMSERILPKLSRVEATQENTGQLTIKIVRGNNTGTAGASPSPAAST